MTAEMISIVLWTFVFAFVVCVGTGLAVILGLYEPKDPAVKTWLTRGLVFTIVGTVASVGGYAMKTGHLPLRAEAAPTDSAELGSGPAQGAGALRDVTGPSGSPTERPVKPPVVEEAKGDREDGASTLAADHPADVKAWADTDLGKRPMLDVPPYPDCVADLRGLAPTDIGPADANACARQLSRYHQAVIVSFYNTKAPYDTALEAQEAKLRKGGITDGEQPRYNYVLSEMERLNGADSEEFKSLTDLEQKIRSDRQSCINNGCQ